MKIRLGILTQNHCTQDSFVVILIQMKKWNGISKCSRRVFSNSNDSEDEIQIRYINEQIRNLENGHLKSESNENHIQLMTRIDTVLCSTVVTR